MSVCKRIEIAVIWLSKCGFTSNRFITNHFDKYFLFQNKQLQCYFSVQFCCSVVSKKKNLVNHTVSAFKRFYLKERE